MSKYSVKPILPEGLKTHSIKDRPSKVDVESFARPLGEDTIRSFVDSLPDILAGRAFRELLGDMSAAKRGGRPCLFGLGAHVIKVGLSPVLIDLMKEGWISGLALNGACIIHDFEIAFAGKTSEDVPARLEEGCFGAAEETGAYLNQAVVSGAKEGLGLGEAVGGMIARSSFPFKGKSLLGAAYERNIPVTVHVAVGTDIIHYHPSVDGGALGKTSLQDFFLFCALVEKLKGGVYLNIGSAVILPEVFLKALSFARNRGKDPGPFSTAVFDFIRHYRPHQNVTTRPVEKQGRGAYFIGHHELMVPLMAAALKFGVL
jgi:hypothetical protein